MASAAELMAGRPRKRTRTLDADPPFSSLVSSPASGPTATPSTSPTSTPASGDQDDDAGSQESQLRSTALDLVPWRSSSPPARRRRLSKSSSKHTRPSARTPSPTSGSSARPVERQVFHGPPTPHQLSLVFSPEIPSRHVELNLANPFEDNADAEQRHLEVGKHRISAETGVNGYIKLAQRQFSWGPRTSNNAPAPRIGLKLSAFPMHWYGSLNRTDQRLFDFYVGPWCDGRTILKKTNSWLKDIAQMAHKDDCVKHAIFALAATYVVDYQPDEQVRQAALVHYKRAVVSLSLLLSNARQQTPSDRDGEALVAAIALLTMIDVVSPEGRRDPHHVPRWLEGSRLACHVLDMTDPGHRYRDANNIQPSAARIGNTIIAGRTAILALPMAPLDLSNTRDEKQFLWLLQGPVEDIRRIHGGCGLSPMLLRAFFQITYMAAFIHANPRDCEFVTVPMAVRMLDELKRLCQWYEYEHPTNADVIIKVSIDVCTIRDLLRTGHLDANGSIRTNQGMTASTAEAWRLAAIIYLQCRVLRLPRTHPEVLAQAASLAECIRVMPTSGYMFTAQAPFFPVFLLGIVAVREEHSQCALRWFHSVIRTGCRSSVPPAFEALERTRAWMATNIKDAPLPIPKFVSERYAWWEDVVGRVAEVEKPLCLV